MLYKRYNIVFLSLPMLSRCTNVGIARAAPCTSSANDRRRTRVIAIVKASGHREKCTACIEIVSQCSVAKNHRRYIAEQRRAAHNSRRTFDEAHHGSKCPRHISDISATHRRCSQHAIVNIGDVYSIL